MKVYHAHDIFMENYRLLHITWNNPQHFWLMRQVTNEVNEWNMCVPTLKVMGTGKPL